MMARVDGPRLVAGALAAYVLLPLQLFRRRIEASGNELSGRKERHHAVIENIEIAEGMQLAFVIDIAVK